MAAGRGGSNARWLPEAFGHLSFAVWRAVGFYPGILYHGLDIQRAIQKGDRVLVVLQSGNAYDLFWNSETFS